MNVLRTRVLASALALAALLGGTPLRAQTGSAVRPPREDSEAWEWVAGSAALGSAALLDGRIRRMATHTPEPVAERMTAIGNRIGHSRIYYAGFAALGAAGLVAGDTPLVHGSLRSATVLAVNGLATGLLKRVVGRGRPIVPDADGDEFHPMSGDDAWQSFPSRHTSTAFAMASVAAAEFHDPAVTAVAYGAAAFVGLSRIEAKAHWTSDVVAGAILGLELSQGMERWMGAPQRHDGSRERGASIPALYLGVRLPAP
jgi:membrane-associated phospholipid phosphatase